MLLLEELVAVFTALFDAVSVTSIQPCAYREKAYSLKFTMPYKSLNPTMQIRMQKKPSQEVLVQIPGKAPIKFLIMQQGT